MQHYRTLIIGHMHSLGSSSIDCLHPGLSADRRSSTKTTRCARDANHAGSTLFMHLFIAAY
jgi:hypothetical protein